MVRMRRIWAVGALVAGIALDAAAAPPADPGFRDWLAGLRDEARAAGIEEATFERAFAGVQPQARIVELDRRQPEFVESFWRYLDARVTADRIENGRSNLYAYQPLLDDITARFGVPAPLLVALWGLESNFGASTGQFRALEATATLAYDERRSPFFRAEVLALLGLIQSGDVPFGARASWAGAMGQPQFMPTTYRDHAIDYDGDGRRDLWRSTADVLASAANYLAATGWDRETTWGQEVVVPAGFDYAQADLEIALPVARWRQMGVEDAAGGALAHPATPAALLFPNGAANGPAFLVYPNFKRIMVWNRSILYALAAGHLADRIQGAGPLATPRREDWPELARADVIEMQILLAQRGFDPGGTDGVVGPRTRQAIRGFQKAGDLPADGFPNHALLARLRATATP
jgi:membrane-bound lytic murein transglycosylase B